MTTCEAYILEETCQLMNRSSEVVVQKATQELQWDIQADQRRRVHQAGE